MRKTDGDDACPLLPRVGQALWGTRWQSDMASALGVEDRTVRRWAAGSHIKPGVWGDLTRIMQERTAVLDRLAGEVCAAQEDATS